MALHVRPLSAAEQRRVEKLAHARTEPARLVERARIVWLSSQGWWVPEIAEQLGVNEATVRRWVKRFNEQGLAGLEDRPRSGCPPTYTSEQVAEVIAAALTKPDELGLPFGAWTLDRLAAYLNEQKGIAIKRSRIDEILIAEGLRWRAQETWFGERVDPDFAQKRGRSLRSTRHLQRVASS
jgi:transposase